MEISDDAKCYAATPAATLEQHITDSNVAKSEAEWWAHDEIARLREENARLREALRPFAMAAHSDIDSNLNLLHAICSLTLDDFRRARAAIQDGGRDD